MPEETKKPELITSPRLRILAHPDQVEKIRGVTRSPVAIDTLNVCLAEMAINGSSREQLDGARSLMGMFVNFAEPDKKSRPLPVKKLKAE